MTCSTKSINHVSNQTQIKGPKQGGKIVYDMKESPQFLRGSCAKITLKIITVVSNFRTFEKY